MQQNNYIKLLFIIQFIINNKFLIIMQELLFQINDEIDTSVEQIFEGFSENE